MWTQVNTFQSTRHSVFLPGSGCAMSVSELSQCNVVATLLGGTFKEFVERRVRESEEEYREVKHTNFQAIPEFVSLIKEDQILSS